LFAIQATAHPAPIPQEAAGSCRRHPPIPAGQEHKALLAPQIPAQSRLARNYQDRPVTPEVAGSSPVAPVENILQIGIFRCLSWRRRPPASRRPPALIPHGRSAASRTPKVLQTGIFCAGLGARRATRSSVIPRRSRSRITVLRIVAAARQHNSANTWRLG